ncbi:winged helix-turn-helix domain-containing protein [Alishewanella tabrizica]|uniref:OmpR/PhoB-type domain-containing protein n=1 Tax=Alishewanella tabrizica TaxID=671278 RepID=A0ABQ2WLM2_9ALTE|nr:transcriptional regulator [Alishewanella tabrizica]GGW61473.1 hypothetical protein GCM10008111_17070 [Alishewanella tabrizica]
MDRLRFKFEHFELAPEQRQLFQSRQLVELNSRYFDALLLMLQHAGKLVTKQQFFDQVWPGIVVSDEALTQCIRTLRRLLNDSATKPHFIETVPKHGYRFIAPVAMITSSLTPETDTPLITNKNTVISQSLFWQYLGSGIGGAICAGVLGGILYGMLAMLLAPSVNTQTLSLCLVTTCITLLLAMLAGAAITAAISAVRIHFPNQPYPIVFAGMVGGLVIGGFANLLFSEMLTLFFAGSPSHLTGAPEGAIIGGATALGVIASKHRKSTAFLHLVWPGLLAGGGIYLTGGNLLAGSLMQLASEFRDAPFGQLLQPALFLQNEHLTSILFVCTLAEAILFIAGVLLGLRHLNNILSQTIN